MSLWSHRGLCSKTLFHKTKQTKPTNIHKQKTFGAWTEARLKERKDRECHQLCSGFKCFSEQQVWLWASSSKLIDSTGSFDHIAVSLGLRQPETPNTLTPLCALAMPGYL